MVRITIQAYVPRSLIATEGWNLMTLLLPEAKGEALVRSISDHLALTEATYFRHEGMTYVVSR